MAHGTLTSLSVKARLLDLPLRKDRAIHGSEFLIYAHLVVIGAAPEEHLVFLIKSSRVEG